MPPRRGPTQARAQRMAKAVQMIEAGSTYQHVADTLGISKTQAIKDVKQAIRDTYQGPADELRALEARRLDALQRGIWIDALKGDLKAISTVQRLMDHRAKLFGLYTQGSADESEQVLSKLDELLEGK